MKWAIATVSVVIVFAGFGVFMANQVWAPEEIEMINKNDPASQATSTDTYATTSDETVAEFKRQLEEEVRIEVGQPVEGYSPELFLNVFPGLTKEDFDGVRASIGTYVYEGGELMHDIGSSEFVHSAAGAVSNEGLKQLLDNIMERTGVNHEVEKISEIMEKLRSRSTLEIYDVDASDGKTWVECSPESKLPAMCTMEYAPVCGLVEVQCVTTPCNPVPETFSNPCVACSRGNVSAYTSGECSAE